MTGYALVALSIAVLVALVIEGARGGRGDWR